MDYFNFNSKFSANGIINMIPFLSVPIKQSDKTYLWNSSDRLDKISQKFYGHPYGGTLLKIANAAYGKTEDEWPQQCPIVIPFPYNDSIQQWIESFEQYKKLYAV